mgnify:CR=1 FL=1
MKKGIVVILLGFLASCMGPKNLQNRVNSKDYTTPMVYTSPLVKDKSDINVQVQFENLAELDELTLVTKDRGYYIPLILLYLWDYDMNITLGDEATNPSITSSIETITKTVFERSGRFNVSEDESAAYKARVILKNVNFNCDYKRFGSAVGAYANYNESADKSKGVLEMQLVLEDKNGNVILDEVFEKENTIGFVGNSESITKIKHLAMRNLIENLSLTAERVAIDMVDEINSNL